MVISTFVVEFAKPQQSDEELKDNLASKCWNQYVRVCLVNVDLV